MKRESRDAGRCLWLVYDAVDRGEELIVIQFVWTEVKLVALG